MQTIKLKTFEEFEQRVMGDLKRDREKRGENSACISPMLFRGQANASWLLKTTLERYSSIEYSMDKYFKVMRSIRPEVQSRTGKRWFFPSEYSPEHDEVPRRPQGYPFMVYLRHHGFPSPLLDWTRSFYIAAFFAFRSARKYDDPNAAIYLFCGQDVFGKGGTIVSVGPYVTTHERHFNQQCEYTFCKKRMNTSSIDRQYIYSNHEEAFTNRNDDTRAVLVKFILPRTERTRVLERLHMMNVTAFSLFGGEESLLETMAYKEI